MKKSIRKTDVLVVGAGPVGMFTALYIAQSGLDVHVIDKESGVAGHSYACALHPASLALLDEVGIAKAALGLGFRIDRIRYFGETSQQLELNLGTCGCEYPFLLALPQSALEYLLESHLKQIPNVKLHWRHRLQDLRLEGDEVTALIEELEFDGRGYSVPDFDLSVKREAEIRANFIVGADGHNSVTRRRLGIPVTTTGKPERFVLHEIETEGPLEPVLNIILSQAGDAVMWPLGQNQCRWSFQVPSRANEGVEEKERTRMFVIGSQPHKLQVQRLLQERAPWFQNNVVQLGWSAEVQFGCWSAAQFQRGHAFLAGDAAHQTGPISMGSMNAGFQEGANLARKLREISAGGAPTEICAAYERENRGSWQELRNKTQHATTGAEASAWTRKHCDRIIATLPLSGKELDDVLHSIGIEANHLALGSV